MKQHEINFLFTILIVTVVAAAFSADVVIIDVQKKVKNKQVVVINREVTFIDENGYHGIHLNDAYEDGIVWLKDFTFENGEIEFDVRGKDVKQHSFVGIAFHGVDTTTFECIYLRPFQFKQLEEPFKSRAIQYIARPTYTWQVLRAQFPSKYESAISSPPDPNNWVHMRVVISGKNISTYINQESKPSMVVESLGKNKTGSIGFYVADTSGGDFANLRVTRD